MEVNDYVRTKWGDIERIIRVDNDNIIVEIEEDEDGRTYSKMCHKEDVFKSSSNIIDLIEVGDYVNGDRVKALKGDIESHKINNEDDVIYTEYINDYDEWCGFEEDEIKSIVTKEQFSQIEYKVGE